MTLTERFNCWKKLAEQLQSTNSIVEKRIILNNAPNEMNDDIQYIFEILSGQHKFGFTYYRRSECVLLPNDTNGMTIKQYLEQLNYCNIVNYISLSISCNGLIVCSIVIPLYYLILIIMRLNHSFHLYHLSLSFSFYSILEKGFEHISIH